MGLTLFGVSVLVFGMIRLVPGTVVEQLLGQAAIASPEVLARFRRFFGLDRPLHVQYLDWLGGRRAGRPGRLLAVGPARARALPRAGAGVGRAGRPRGGLVALPRHPARRRCRRPGRAGRATAAIRVLATLGLSLPAFWQGTVLILLFSVYLGWMPSLQWVPFLQRPGGKPPHHGAARADPRHRDRRHDHAHVPLVDAGRARTRVRADRAGQGSVRRDASPTTMRCGTR